LEIDGIDLDLVTESRHDIQISEEGVLPFLDKMRVVLFHMANNHEQAAFHIQDMIRAITKGEVTYLIYNDAMCRLGLVPGQYSVTELDHHMHLEFSPITLDTAAEDEAALREIASLLQGHCNDLMRDDPKAAFHKLNCAIKILTGRVSTSWNTIHFGEKIDP
jgi:hypothetical protein